MEYALLDSGNGKKLEQFGSYRLIRPCSAAVWAPKLSKKEWNAAHSEFSREEKSGWSNRGKLPERWRASLKTVNFHLKATDFGHLGIFPEHAILWEDLRTAIQSSDFQPSVLNLFAYSGAATLAAAKSGAKVCHVDASKGMVDWARENAKLNRLDNKPIRWIVDDVFKFLEREIRRENSYDIIILDPPSFGRGSKRELFKIESDVLRLLQLCRDVLSDTPKLILFSCHTPGFSPLVMQHLMQQFFGDLAGKIDSGEMRIPSKTAYDLPMGTFARWKSC